MITNKDTDSGTYICVPFNELYSILFSYHNFYTSAYITCLSFGWHGYAENTKWRC